jgi:hypothetical protein
MNNEVPVVVLPLRKLYIHTICFLAMSMIMHPPSIYSDLSQIMSFILFQSMINIYNQATYR